MRAEDAMDNDVVIVTCRNDILLRFFKKLIIRGISGVFAA